MLFRLTMILLAILFSTGALAEGSGLDLSECPKDEQRNIIDQECRDRENKKMRNRYMPAWCLGLADQKQRAMALGPKNLTEEQLREIRDTNKDKLEVILDEQKFCDAFR